MKATLFAWLLLLLLAGPAWAETKEPRVRSAHPGVELAHGISELTGVAISPLLGVSAVGAWDYWHASEVEREALPWFDHPWAWGTGLCLIAICFLKDLFGTAAPPLLKKPLDVLELFENKLSALVACVAFVPFLAWPPALREEPAGALLHGQTVHYASALPFDASWLAVPLAMAGFLVVWLTAHSINVLIALCPFGFIDALLKLFKTALLSLMVALSFIHPYLGGAFAVVVIVVAALLAPWAFRLTLFGTLFGWDILFWERAQTHLRLGEPHAFLARGSARVPARTFGRLVRGADGAATFRYRPWLVLPERSLPLPAGSIAVAKGVLFPSLLHGAATAPRRRIFLTFLPRYRSHEETIASTFAIGEIEPSPVLKGFRAVRAWFAEVLSLGRRVEIAR